MAATREGGHGVVRFDADARNRAEKTGRLFEPQSPRLGSTAIEAALLFALPPDVRGVLLPKDAAPRVVDGNVSFAMKRARHGDLCDFVAGTSPADRRALARP